LQQLMLIIIKLTFPLPTTNHRRMFSLYRYTNQCDH
jgi:hypothetical protein